MSSRSEQRSPVVVWVRGPGIPRRKLHLGSMTAQQACRVKLRIKRLVDAVRLNETPDEETRRWVAGVGQKIRQRLHALGLITDAGRRDATLGQLLDEFFTALTVKPGTETTYRQTRRCLLDYFEEQRPLSGIGPLEADKFKQHLRSSGLAQATVSKRVKTARQIFRGRCGGGRG